jgi:predicted transcriptional regulator
MRKPVDPNVAASRASDIVIAFLAANSVPAEQLPDMVRLVRDALQDSDPATPEGSKPSRTAVGAASAADSPSPSETSIPQQETTPEPAVARDQSITRDYLISLEDGQPYRSLRRHLMARYNMTPDDYRRKWGLPPDYPMVAPSYSEERAAVAKRSGLGTKKVAKKAAAKVKVRTAPRTRRPSQAPARA